LCRRFCTPYPLIGSMVCAGFDFFPHLGMGIKLTRNQQSLAGHRKGFRSFPLFTRQSLTRCIKAEEGQIPCHIGNRPGRFGL
jgi:hypothetical protein